uniref:Uncharacterized protein n=1 Tax=Vespula pensylvanica TaxID=30213 RepID=A0A834U4S0_VESPE|nr:hypothetical protein H0235_011038 [Vespula pensylvanica]
MLSTFFFREFRSINRKVGGRRERTFNLGVTRSKEDKGGEGRGEEEEVVSQRRRRRRGVGLATLYSEPTCLLERGVKVKGASGNTGRQPPKRPKPECSAGKRLLAVLKQKEISNPCKDELFVRPPKRNNETENWNVWRNS